MADTNATTVQDDLIDARRAQVALLRQSGFTYREIASELKVAVGTVSGDMKEIRAEWAKQYTGLFDEFLLDLSRIDLAIQAITGDVMRGDLAAIDRFLGLLARRAKMFGYDQDERIKAKFLQDLGMTSQRSVDLREPDEYTDEELWAIVQEQELVDDS